jgi:hypothetical protein
MNQINFEREFDERLSSNLESALVSIFGQDVVDALKAMPTADGAAGVIYVDGVNDLFKAST